MATSARRSGLVCYIVQRAEDNDTHPIVAHEVTIGCIDRDQLSPMAEAVCDEPTHKRGLSAEHVGTGTRCVIARFARWAGQSLMWR